MVRRVQSGGVMGGFTIEEQVKDTQSHLEAFQSLFIQCSNWLREVTEGGWVG